MPTYEYRCEHGHDFEVRASMSSRPVNPPCPEKVFIPDAEEFARLHDVNSKEEDLLPGQCMAKIVELDDGTMAKGVILFCHGESKQIFRTAPMIWTSETHKTILDYKGSKRLKAGYSMSHGDKFATKVSSGAGGMINPRTSAEHPLAARVMPEQKTSVRRRLGLAPQGKAPRGA